MARKPGEHSLTDAAKNKKRPALGFGVTSVDSRSLYAGKKTAKKRDSLWLLALNEARSRKEETEFDALTGIPLTQDACGGRPLAGECSMRRRLAAARSAEERAWRSGHRSHGSKHRKQPAGQQTALGLQGSMEDDCIDLDRQRTLRIPIAQGARRASAMSEAKEISEDEVQFQARISQDPRFRRRGATSSHLYCRALELWNALKV
eukprot:TRINITY_DN112757_c0_g1_i1.p1 TRINITY_DN112757_c0_g1~~TRINITY_DN112757_c0_g1_i1.p1  ORF type:complete len:205 (+),score=29.40 TRINITY_DN112757_c0_g1_i1:79-693(+)